MLKEKKCVCIEASRPAEEEEEKVEAKGELI
jgi:hypothetical protein